MWMWRAQVLFAEVYPRPQGSVHKYPSLKRSCFGGGGEQKPEKTKQTWHKSAFTKTPHFRPNWSSCVPQPGVSYWSSRSLCRLLFSSASSKPVLLFHLARKWCSSRESDTPHCPLKTAADTDGAAFALMSWGKCSMLPAWLIHTRQDNGFNWHPVSTSDSTTTHTQQPQQKAWVLILQQHSCNTAPLDSPLLNRAGAEWKTFRFAPRHHTQHH